MHRKRSSGSSLSPHRERSTARVSEVRSNGALFMENIKQEVESIDADVTPSRIQTAFKSRPSLDSHGILETDTDLIRRGGSISLRTCKEEHDASPDSGDSTFSLFASLLDSALQGLISIPDLILHFENCCRDVSESIRYGSNEMHRVMEDKLMRQKARILLDEAASWSLLWHLYGKGNEELPEDLILLPTTSHLEACQFVVKNHTAQLCLRIVQWLEGLASKALDLDRKINQTHNLTGMLINPFAVLHISKKEETYSFTVLSDVPEGTNGSTVTL
uniref:Nuclear pore complex protein NUP107-like n=1 Tax=Nicotiana tabacum TaxID=4097 RepID=A0A1S4DGV6_TOBAC|nr:PREDICTED: nuclear pore complex protein NUP107-like [Nicotiana tabacum]